MSLNPHISATKSINTKVRSVQYLLKLTGSEATVMNKFLNHLPLL
uniref:Uncharacterized protein n=1 Tax=Rhizophora mucronata TaxID=61149 RepID=A0A2P2N050_RHIMU